jgi:hypothetical protein
MPQPYHPPQQLNRSAASSPLTIYTYSSKLNYYRKLEIGLPVLQFLVAVNKRNERSFK